FGLFRYCTNLDTKRAELVQLMQKFVPRSRLRIFGNERTRSTPLDPKLMFRCVSNHLGALGLFGCLTKLEAKQAELVQKFVPRSRIRIFLNERIRSTPLDPKLKILVCFIIFRCIWDRLVA